MFGPFALMFVLHHFDVFLIFQIGFVCAEFEGNGFVDINPKGRG
jgi:hypothetical protein